MTLTRITLTCILVALTTFSTAAQTSWPQFRGLHGGVAENDPLLPDTWGPDENIVWRVDVPGRGWSSPIVSGDHVFLTSVVNTTGVETPIKPLSQYQSRSFDGPMTGADLETPSAPLRWVLYDVDFETGAVRWERTLHTATPGAKHEKNSYASETPVTDGDRVYVYLGYLGLFAFDLDGTQLWHTLMDAPEMRQGWGTASSPVVHGDRLFLVSDSLEQSFIAAYDTGTGAELWRVGPGRGVQLVDPRSSGKTTYAPRSSPREQVGCGRMTWMAGTLWSLEGMSSIHVATPFTRHGLLYINSGYTADSNRPVYAVRSGAAGDVSLPDGSTSNDYVVWSHPTLGSYITLRRWSTGTTTTRCSIGEFCSATMPRRAPKWYPRPESVSRGHPVHGVRPGPTTTRFSPSARMATPMW